MLPGLFSRWYSKLRGAAPSGGSRTALIEFQAHAPVLPILSRQLREAAQDMESEVSKVCQSFQGMASKAMGTVQNAAHILDADTEDGTDIASVIAACRETMVTLLDRMERGGDISQRAIRNMEKVEAIVGEVDKVLRQVDQSSFASKMVALNAKIEAAHLGEAGRGFEIVAEEISVQAGRSTALTGEVGQILQRLVANARLALGELREISTADQAWIQSSRDDIHRTLAALENANGELRGSLKVASEQSGELAADIAAAVMDLQFQDRVSQRIQHAVESLDAMHRAIMASEIDGVSEEVEGRRGEISRELASSYTMASERAVHDGASSAPSGNNQESDVELF